MRRTGLAAACLLLVALRAAAAGTFYEDYRRGLELEAAGRLEAARAALLEAARERPEPGRNVRTYGLNFLPVYDPYLALARIEVRLGRLEEAATHLERSRRAGVSPSEEIAAVERALAAARRRAARTAPPTPTPPPPSPTPSPEPTVAAPSPTPTPVATPRPAARPGVAPSGVLEVASWPEGAAVLLDGTWVGRTPERLEVPPGPHEVRVEAPGRRPYRERVAVPAGGRVLVRARLLRARPPASTPTVRATVGTAMPPSGATPTPRPSTLPSPTAPPPTAGAARAAGPRRAGGSWRWAVLVAAAGVAAALALRLRRRRGPGGREPTDGLPTAVERTLAERASEPSPPEAPRRLAGYELVGVLGQGGMATTYLARRMRDGLPVALKVPHPHVLRDPEFVQRFVREGRLGSTLHHPNIVRIYEAGEAEGRPFIAMELLEGESLERHLRLAPLPVREALRITRGIAEALDYAHMKGVVHRDLKPDNVLLTVDGTVKVMDYGIARVTTSPGLTSTGTYLGTPHYSAPESLTPERLDHRADLYSLGIILYRMLTGRLPFTARTPLELLEKHRSEPLPPPPPRLGIPPDVWRLVERLTAKDPADRFPSAESLLVAVGRILNRL